MLLLYIFISDCTRDYLVRCEEILMKKRKWSIWLILFLVKVIADLIISSLCASMAEAGNLTIVPDFVNTSVGTDVLLTFVVLIGTKLRIRRVFKDERFELKYHFWTAGIIGFLIAVINFIKGANYDVISFTNNKLIAEANGEVLMGHAAPAFTLLYMAFSSFCFVYYLFEGISVQVKYSKLRKAQMSVVDVKNHEEMIND